jgi:hypothetical protein
MVEPMTVQAFVINKDQIIVRVPPDVPVSELQTCGEDIAEIIDERIASDFANERAAGKALGGISEEHEQRKARDGLMLEKGHMTGDLQDALDSGGFWRVTARRGRIDIEWREDDLYGAVPHAEPYAETKVSGGKILVVLTKDAKTAQDYVRERMADLAEAA